MVKHVCPVCGGPWPADDEAFNRPCPKCRSIEGTLSELAVTFACVARGFLPVESLQRYVEWPRIEHLSCKLFGHASFTIETWRRLESFLLAEDAEDRQSILAMPRAEVVRLLRGECRPSESAPVAVYLGHGRVEVGPETFSLTVREDTVLAALVDAKSASKEELETLSGYSDAVRVLRAIARKYPILETAILFPGRKGRGGYRTTICRAQ